MLWAVFNNVLFYRHAWIHLYDHKKLSCWSFSSFYRYGLMYSFFQNVVKKHKSFSISRKSNLMTLFSGEVSSCGIDTIIYRTWKYYSANFKLNFIYFIKEWQKKICMHQLGSLIHKSFTKKAHHSKSKKNEIKQSAYIKNAIQRAAEKW